jgi:dimeric dUTPase (all-alpha-NTP-PPase superfamily)
MNLAQLFTMQQQLDGRIEREHHLQNESLFERKVLALLVELGELANETRCFKFWSKKPSSKKEVVLEEYVDGFHFILSLGIELNFHEELKNIEAPSNQQDVVAIFMKVYAIIMDFKENPTKELYQQLIATYISLGQALDFSVGEIEDGYLQKNMINHDRQDNGY